MALKRIVMTQRVYESDYLTAQRTARAWTKFHEHRDRCPDFCMRGHIEDCWQGRDLWNAAKRAAIPRYEDIPVSQLKPRT